MVGCHLRYLANNAAKALSLRQQTQPLAKAERQ